MHLNSLPRYFYIEYLQVNKKTWCFARISDMILLQRCRPLAIEKVVRNDLLKRGLFISLFRGMQAGDIYENPIIIEIHDASAIAF